MMQTQRKYIFIGLGAIVVILLLFIAIRSVTKFGTLTVSVPSNIQKNTEVSVEVLSPEKDKPAASFKLKPGETRSVRLHTGNYQVNGSTATIKAVDVVTINASKTTELSTPSGEQHAIKQLGTNADCVAMLGGKVFSYTCKGGEGAVRRHGNALGVGDNYLYEANRFVDLQLTANGFLGFFSETKQNELQYLQPQNESIGRITLPSAVQKLLDKEQPNIITQQLEGSTRFALLFGGQNHMYLFQSLDDKNPAEIKLSNGLQFNDTKRKYSATFDTDRLVLYAGVATDTEEGTVGDEDETAATLPTYEIEYDTAGKQLRSVELPKETIGDSFHHIGGNFYTLSHPYGVDFLYYENGSFKTIYTLSDVAGWANQNGNLYIQSDSVLYKFVPGKNGSFGMHSQFSSSDFQVSALYRSSQGLLFTAFAGNDEEAPLNIYQLLDTPQVGKAPAVVKQPTIPGLDVFLEYGLTDEQINNLKAAFATYALSKEFTIDAVAATNIQSVWRDPESSATIDIIDFETVINRSTTFKAKIEYSDLTSVRLYLYDKTTGALVFDSAAL